MQDDEQTSVSTRLSRQVHAAIAETGGWLPFDRYMALALYAPGLGYYSRDSRQFGTMPGSGSDFVTAPELSPLFGAALARQVAQAVVACGIAKLWEFGAGSGALAEQLLDALDALGAPATRYAIVDVSSALRARQQARLARFGARVQWLDRLPENIDGVVIGNEVLDAMPVQLLRFDGSGWFERGVVSAADGGFAWDDRATALRPPLVDATDAPFVPGAITEIHHQAEAFVRTIGTRLRRGAAFFVDYGFPQAEYYHPQRSGGTLMCHRGHLADADPLQFVGDKDITAHVDFTGIALAAQEVGCEVIGYTTQAHFLINCGLLDLLEGAGPRTIAPVQKLLAEHEMGELFKVLAFAKGCGATLTSDPIGFRHGDRTRTL